LAAIDFMMAPLESATLLRTQLRPSVEGKFLCTRAITGQESFVRAPHNACYVLNPGRGFSSCRYGREMWIDENVETPRNINVENQ
jgi:hypothetical protein